jgi:allantoicase
MREAGAASFFGLVDLAASALGGKALAASDEFFAEKENLTQDGRGVFIPDKFTERGKWMDGWETRRSRRDWDEFDWCILRLGVPGVIRGVDIDTNHFLGNHPPFASLEAATIEGDPSVEQLTGDETLWREVLRQSALKPGSQNLFSVGDPDRVTHVRLKIFPDGGVARLRLYGDVRPDRSFAADEEVDLAALVNGGRALACSDMFFGDMVNLIMPGRARTMGEGWESRRRRGPGHDWAIVELARPGNLTWIEVDTNHFKGNFPARCSIEGIQRPGARPTELMAQGAPWEEVLPETSLAAHTRHEFRELAALGPYTHIRLNTFPDGGISRLRVHGRPVDEGAGA